MAGKDRNREESHTQRPGGPRETDQTPDREELDRHAQPGRQGGEERERDMEHDRDIEREQPGERQSDDTPGAPLI